MRGCSLGCSFNGEIEEYSLIETGIPQGSPVSPILFLIYIRELFPPSKIVYFSYIDDVVLVASSGSYKRNKRLLEEEVKELFKRGEENYVEFDLRKTEFLNFRSKTEGSEARTTSIRLPDGNEVKSGFLVRWLGVYFDPGLTFKEYVSIRVSQARSAFLRLSRLANVERGLSPHAVRQLYLACVTTVADYGLEIYWKGQVQFKRQLQTL